MKTQYVAAAVLSALILNPLPAGAEGKDGVAAVVNGKKITVAEIKKTYESDLAGKVYLKQEVEKKISDNDVKNFYNQYKKEFKPQKEMRARHILVDSEATANDIITKIKKGDDFNELAKKYSKEKNPDLGYFTKEMMVPEFGDAAFRMKKGQYSQKPIKTNFGYHIIIVDDVRDSKPVSFEEAEPQIRTRMAQELLPGVLNDVVAKAKIEKYQLDGKVMPNTPAVSAPAAK